jgi:uncharacterized protein (TIGR01319 family)
MKIDVLVAEIGSTTTLINAFNVGESIQYLGQGVSNTTVETDVNNGLEEAIVDLCGVLGVDKLDYDVLYASSSAAGGLKMTVHGLVYEMTVRASKEAALNAGANIHLITASKIKDKQLQKIKEIKPNIILIAGGTDYGETETALYNMQQVLTLDLDVPIIYAGNIAIQEDIIEMFQEQEKMERLTIVENVYPRVDYLNILPLRKAIYETFEKHIIHAKGMNHIKDLVKGRIMPTPGSVMEATLLLHEVLGNVMTIDVGGATTDIHSVSYPSEDYKEFLEGEPLSKRSVEGDLGVFINHKNVIELMSDYELYEETKLSKETVESLLGHYTYIPETRQEQNLVYALTKKCVNTALDRHIGDLRRVFTTSGQKIIPEGKDCSMVEYIILTGGALIHLDKTEDIIREYLSKHPMKLAPHKEVKIVKDKDYIMASAGVLSLGYKEQAIALLKQSLGIEV